MRNLVLLRRQFLEYIEIEKGRSLKTVVNYARYLDRFLAFARLKQPKDITIDTIREYRLFLNRQYSGKVLEGRNETLKKRTQNYYLVALRSFLKYLVRRNIQSLPSEQVELAKVGERSFDLISRDELQRLLDAPCHDKTEKETFGRRLRMLRDKAILELLFSTGLRVSELCSLPRDINLKNDELSVWGKGEKVRVVVLSSASKEAIKEYLSVRTDMDEALFIQCGRSAKNARELRLTPRSIQRLIKNYATIAGISKKVTPHVIRHFFATDLLRNGADIRSVQALLGHANINTTQIYTHVTDQHLLEVHKRFHGRKWN